MYQTEYSKEYSEIKTKIKKNVATIFSKFRLRQFHFTIANIKTFYPEILKKKSAKELFTELLYTRELTPLDANKYTNCVEDIQLKGEYREILYIKKSPLIFCTYHLGSYRAIIGLLSRLGYDFSLVIDQQVYDQQGDNIREIVKSVNEHFNTESDFDLINAEAFDSAMKMVKQLKQGKALVLYVDGNTGTGGVFRHDEKLEVVQFFNQQIFARQGIAYISFLTNVPIVPVISYREDIENKDNISLKNVVLEFFDEINPATTKSKKIYCADTTQRLYKHLEEKLKTYPLQWEGWLYVHKYLDEKSVTIPKEERPIHYQKYKDLNQLAFNEDRYGIFTFGSQYFLFDNQSYTTFIINEEEFSLLKFFLEKEKNLSQAGLNVADLPIDNLLQLGILISKYSSNRSN